VGAEGWFNQLELIAALGTEQTPRLSTAYAARREQQVQETSFDFLHQIHSGQVTLGLPSFRDYELEKKRWNPRRGDEDDDLADEVDELVQKVYDHIPQQQQDNEHNYGYQDYDQGIFDKPLSFFAR